MHACMQALTFYSFILQTIIKASYKMRRGGPGLAALDRSLHSSAQFQTLGSELNANQLQELKNQLDHFSNSLRQFAQQHRKDIVRDAEFRHAFQQMCSNIGVDPLAGGPPRSAIGKNGAGAGKYVEGLWNDFLGLSDFQNELSVQIIDVCISTRERNGGYIKMDDLIKYVNQMRLGTTKMKNKGDDYLITENDVIRSIKLMKPLGSGYEVIELAGNGVKMVRSIPKELDVDSTMVMSLLTMSTTYANILSTDSIGHTYITESDLIQEIAIINKPKWTADRANAVLFGMSIGDGLLWIDEGVHPVRYYALTGMVADV